MAINAGTESAQATFDISFELQPKQQLYGQGEISWQGHQLTLNLPDLSAIIWGSSG